MNRLASPRESRVTPPQADAARERIGAENQGMQWLECSHLRLKARLAIALATTQWPIRPGPGGVATIASAGGNVGGPVTGAAPGKRTHLARSATLSTSILETCVPVRTGILTSAFPR